MLSVAVVLGCHSNQLMSAALVVHIPECVHLTNLLHVHLFLSVVSQINKITFCLENLKRRQIPNTYRVLLSLFCQQQSDEIMYSSYCSMFPTSVTWSAAAVWSESR